MRYSPSQIHSVRFRCQAVVALRTHYQLEGIRFYRLQKVSDEATGRLFLSCLESANALETQPEWV